MSGKKYYKNSHRIFGEDEASSGSDSGLDIIKSSRKALKPQGQSQPKGSVSRQLATMAVRDNIDDDEDDYQQSNRLPTQAKQAKINVAHKARKGPFINDSATEDEPISGDAAEQLSEWSSEENLEAEYKVFKERKTLKRKRVAAETNRIRAEKKSRGAVATAIIGRKSKPKKKGTATRDINYSGSASESENRDGIVTYLEDPTPEYIESRKRKLKKLHEAGLRYPPCYDDIDFSDSESEQKPVLRDIKPQRQKKDLKLSGSNSIIPSPIAQWLRDYQLEGVQFLHDRFVRQTGAILGDDMGLGKTIQVIAFLTVAFGKSATKCDAKRMRKVRRIGDNRWYPRILIVCPGTLMDNWSSELEKWGWWVVSTYHGNPKDRKGVLAAAMNGRLEIMITTYNTYRVNEGEINTVDWDCVIADECHQLKSGHAEITKAMNKINALCRIGLTGTAIQNKYEELWNLLNWARPGSYGSAQSWKQTVCLPLKIGQAHDASFAQLAEARSKAEDLVGTILPDIFLRRMKTLIADQLPKKSDRVVFCQLTETQADAYRAYIESDRCDYIRRAKEPCDCNSGKKRGWCCFQEIPYDGKWVNWMFPAMVTLQKLANHIALLLPNTSDKHEKQEKDLANLQLAFPDDWRDLYRIKDKTFDQAKSEYCGKWRVLKRLLDFWYSNNDKVLVFSHSVRLLRLLKKFFDLDGTKYNLSYLDGSMELKDRAAAVANFNSDPNQFVFLISTKAGGVGLNITSANKVVVMDPNWNPAYDLQAQDRAYRIGQTRDVEVFRLVCSGTIEEIVYARQIYKQQQANIGYTASNERRYFKGVMDEKDKVGELFGLENLFSFKEAGYILKEIVHNTNVAETRAGVTAMDFTLDDDDNDASDEDDVLSNKSLGITGDGDGEYSQMKRFADMATSQGTNRGKKNRGADPINAILAKAGVQYTHENSEIVGRSKIETELGKRAREFRNDVEFGRKRVFNLSQSQSQSHSHQGGHESNSDGINEEDQEEEDAVGTVGRNKQREFKINYRYRPNESIRKRQFCSMAKMNGYDDPTEFALLVESMTQEERRNMLERFYQTRRRQIKKELEES